jgi:hypothetical protein
MLCFFLKPQVFLQFCNIRQCYSSDYSDQNDEWRLIFFSYFCYILTIFILNLTHLNLITSN